MVYFCLKMFSVTGPYGVNHGIECHKDVIDYAITGLERFRQNCIMFDEFEFCEPQFTHGNCLLLSPNCRLYDRIYCGAACPPEHEVYMKKLLNIGGILVMPLNDQVCSYPSTKPSVQRPASSGAHALYVSSLDSGIECMCNIISSLNREVDIS